MASARGNTNKTGCASTAFVLGPLTRSRSGDFRVVCEPSRCLFWDRFPVPELGPPLAVSSEEKFRQNKNGQKSGPSFGPGKRSRFLNQSYQTVPVLGPFSGTETGATFGVVSGSSVCTGLVWCAKWVQIWDRFPVPELEPPAGV